MKVRTRIAPSPTGPLHIGTARTALFGWLYAKQNKGSFILRIEDTDLERSDKRFEKDILEGLSWLGLIWDEDIYRQSERINIYEKYLKKLLNDSKAFWCPHTEEELASEREEQMGEKKPLRHICSFRNENKNHGIIRIKNDVSNNIEFDDMIRGKVSFRSELLGDFVLAKDLKTPLYNFAVVVDDYEIKISHVIRGEDHIPNTPKQILIQRALGIPSPIYAHLPLILGSDRSKLSKRDGATSINEYKKDGYLPEAVVNFMALLGWHPKDDREIFSKEKLLKEFSFDRVQKGGAVFDIKKFNWMNGEYIKSAKTSEISDAFMQFLPNEWQEIANKDKVFWADIINLEKERISKLSEITNLVDYFFKNPYYSKELLRWKDKQEYQDIKLHLNALSKIISKVEEDSFNKDSLQEAIMPYANKQGRGDVLWPLRVALSGKRHSPGPFDIASILGKNTTIERIASALDII